MKYQCQICGYIHDEEKEGKSFKELEKCPDCGSDVSNFEVMEEDTVYKTYECEVCHYVYDEEKEGSVLLNLENAQYADRRYQNSKQSKK